MERLKLLERRNPYYTFARKVLIMIAWRSSFIGGIACCHSSREAPLIK